MSINGNIHYQNNNLDLEGGYICSAWVCQTACQRISESFYSCELFKVLNPRSLSSYLPSFLPSYLSFFDSLPLTTFHPLISCFALLFFPFSLPSSLPPFTFTLNSRFTYPSNCLSLLPTHLRCSSPSYLSPTFPLSSCVMSHLYHKLHGHKHRSKRISKHTHTQHR